MLMLAGYNPLAAVFLVEAGKPAIGFLVQQTNRHCSQPGKVFW
jgi:hypothetical protein